MALIVYNIHNLISKNWINSLYSKKGYLFNYQLTVILTVSYISYISQLDISVTSRLLYGNVYMIVMLYSNHLPIGIVPSIKPKIIAKVVVSAPPHLPVRKLLFSTILIHHCFLKKYSLAKYWTLMQITYYWRKSPQNNF